uniref:ATP-dependent RNA helicase dhh1 n=1 Tax=Arundo donax TaxID=35708 RepID=A0A0A9GDW5_ARUDO
MLTLLWLSEGEHPAAFRHRVVYIARCLFVGLSWPSSFFTIAVFSFLFVFLAVSHRTF